ncbi:RNA polymerase sigma-70 factor (ECF subfamily) [Crossiella equi]|uniref:RNA polymerase sigma-70 factor (ECF subfamily) n=2 Tax=Crossiella equi TaxID=130796 RepID=A0ABS5A8E9_9PSEU|nr:RNA polymerase sigma-70 factor (ECF subfamily) [Crossiella equi]
MTAFAERNWRAMVLAQPVGQPEPVRGSAHAEDDRALWQRAAADDRDAFGVLFERHAEAVWNHCYRLTGSWSAAEDLTSTTFLTAWKKRTELTLVRDSALPWLYTVAGNLARTEFRSASRFRKALTRAGAHLHVVRDHAEDVVAAVDGDARLQKVLAAVDQLPRSEREVVQLCLLGEVSVPEAAQALGVAEVSVRSRISRARARLRELVEEEL